MYTSVVVEFITTAGDMENESNTEQEKVTNTVTFVLVQVCFPLVFNCEIAELLV